MRNCSQESVKYQHIYSNRIICQQRREQSQHNPIERTWGNSNKRVFTLRSRKNSPQRAGSAWALQPAHCSQELRGYNWTRVLAKLAEIGDYDPTLWLRRSVWIWIFSLFSWNPLEQIPRPTTRNSKTSKFRRNNWNSDRKGRKEAQSQPEYDSAVGRSAIGSDGRLQVSSKRGWKCWGWEIEKGGESEAGEDGERLQAEGRKRAWGVNWTLMHSRGAVSMKLLLLPPLLHSPSPPQPKYRHPKQNQFHHICLFHRNFYNLLSWGWAILEKVSGGPWRLHASLFSPHPL